MRLTATQWRYDNALFEVGRGHVLVYRRSVANSLSVARPVRETCRWDRATADRSQWRTDISWPVFSVVTLPTSQ